MAPHEFMPCINLCIHTSAFYRSIAEMSAQRPGGQSYHLSRSEIDRHYVDCSRVERQKPPLQEVIVGASTVGLLAAIVITQASRLCESGI